MIIYSSPKSGKTTFCMNNAEWIDGDTILFNYLNNEFGVTIIDNDTKGQQIIDLFKKDRNKAEYCYTKYLHWLESHKEANNIMIGSRRFMWLAEYVFIKDTHNLEILSAELSSARKWNINYKFINRDEFIKSKLKQLVL